MVVRVKVSIKSVLGRHEVQSPAKVNSAFESDEPEVILPPRLAEKLGLWPSLPRGTEIGSYGTAGGFEAPAYRIRGVLEVKVIEKDRVSNPVKATAAIMSGEREVILSDKLCDELGIELVRMGKGLWRFSGESTVRKSVKSKYW